MFPSFTQNQELQHKLLKFKYFIHKTFDFFIFILYGFSSHLAPTFLKYLVLFEKRTRRIKIKFSCVISKLLLITTELF
jgi:hypothetical protein